MLHYPDYTSGFHIFTNKKDAEIYGRLLENRREGIVMVVEVQYKSLICWGITYIKNTDIQCLDYHLETLVVENIKIDFPVH